MKRELYNYDWFPKVIPVGREMCITVKPLGAHAAFGSEPLRVEILGIGEGNIKGFPLTARCTELTLTADGDGCLRIPCLCPGEEEYYIRIYRDDKRIVQLSVYAVGEDLIGRYPFVGDLHMHTFRSDGREAPAIVAANYRARGYDFLAITDHRRYYPSLEAMDAFRALKLGYTLVPGEEIHMPGNPVHIVNFGGRYSVNGLLSDSRQIEECGEDEGKRSWGMQPPAVISCEAYTRQVEEIAATLDLPEAMKPHAFPYASCLWVFAHIRAAEGLGIFCHPYWISDLISIPEVLSDYMLSTHPFDAYELLGGDLPFTANGFQLLQYYDVRRRGVDFPVVGSTDSHDSTEHSTIGNVAKTMVFAPANTRETLIEAVKAGYSVAVDCRREPGVAGDFRLCKYAWFLHENYFPMHDNRCAAVGALMKDYACGEQEIAEQIEALDRRITGMGKKYFAFD